MVVMVPFLGYYHSKTQNQEYILPIQYYVLNTQVSLYLLKY